MVKARKPDDFAEWQQYWQERPFALTEAARKKLQSSGCRLFAGANFRVNGPLWRGPHQRQYNGVFAVCPFGANVDLKATLARERSKPLAVQHVTLLASRGIYRTIPQLCPVLEKCHTTV
ncbi:hypothetical protein CBL_05422 [Carabus blaptoides fortunei]